MELSSARVLVLGLGRSGKAASQILRRLGTSVIASDSSMNDEMLTVAEELRLDGIEVRLGPQDDNLLDRIELLVVSPGIPTLTPIIASASARNIPVWSEIELACRLTDKQIIAITGTNGKTTTTTIIGKIFEAAGKPAAVAGNIGTPLVAAAMDPAVETLIVEVSSFQLDTISDFRPHIAVLLNITEDHLDWHPDFGDYIRSKKRLFMNQRRGDFSVVNIDDEIVQSLLPELASHPIYISKDKIALGVFVEDGRIIARLADMPGGRNGEGMVICDIDDLKIKGGHNLDNIMAAIAACLAAGIEVGPIRAAITSFTGLSHRIEHVATIQGVAYYDDSKATNVDAAVKAVAAFTEPIVLMVGGRNKGNNFEPLADCLDDRVKAIVGFGEAGQEILGKMPESVFKEYAGNLEDAVAIACSLAKSGYVVLFSPACASFDAFNGYAQRGNAFKRAVLAIGEIDE